MRNDCIENHAPWAADRFGRSFCITKGIKKCVKQPKKGEFQVLPFESRNDQLNKAQNLLKFQTLNSGKCNGFLHNNLKLPSRKTVWLSTRRQLSSNDVDQLQWTAESIANWLDVGRWRREKKMQFDRKLQLPERIALPHFHFDFIKIFMRIYDDNNWGKIVSLRLCRSLPWEKCFRDAHIAHNDDAAFSVPAAASLFRLCVSARINHENMIFTVTGKSFVRRLNGKRPSKCDSTPERTIQMNDVAGIRISVTKTKNKCQKIRVTWNGSHLPVRRTFGNARKRRTWSHIYHVHVHFQLTSTIFCCFVSLGVVIEHFYDRTGRMNETERSRSVDIQKFIRRCKE